MKKKLSFSTCLSLLFILFFLARCSSPSGGDSAEPAPAPEPEPKNPLTVTDLLAAPAIYGGEITLSWTNPAMDEFDGVEISASPAEGSLSTPQIVAKLETSYKVNGLTNKTPYTFSVRTLDASGGRGEVVSQTGTPADTRGKGLYSGSSPTPESIASFTLTSAIDWLKRNAQTNTEYLIVLDQNQKAGAIKLDASVLNGKSDIGITIRGEKTNCTITMTGINLGPLFTINARNKLVLDENITLQGGKNNNSLVLVQDLGTFVMKGGVIRDNANTNTGSGGVTVNIGGLFIMEDGTITNNTTNSYGGGVLVEGGTFTMKGGAIRGNISDFYGDGACIRRPNSATGKTTGTLTMSGSARIDIIGLYNSNPGYSSVDIAGSFTGADTIARIDLAGESTIASWRNLLVLKRADGYTGPLSEKRFVLGKDRAKDPIKGYHIESDGTLRQN
ncbi:MAG: fibronectin type III domain-containing protein [Spirochaetales bacterium]|jgi:hypothetical protein|nr:fibronectin type III domain-containing protein [Spirochaetales bacterium]